MYRIYADDVIIHDDKFLDNNIKLISPKLTLQDSSAGSLTFTCTKLNPGYEKIQRFTTHIIVQKETNDGMKEIWAGRVIEESEDFWKNRKFICEGELAYLNDTLQPPHAYHNITPKDLLETFLNIHNEKVSEDKRFYVGYISPSIMYDDDVPIPEELPKYIRPEEGTLYDPSVKYYTPVAGETDRYVEYGDTTFWTSETDVSKYDYIYIKNPEWVDPMADLLYRYTNRETTLECINDKLLNRLGGHMVIRKSNGKRYLDYYDDFYNTSSQVVEFGTNLLDFTKNWDLTDFATVIVPLGASIQHEEDYEYDDDHPKALTEYITVESVNDGSPYVVATEPIERFGWVEKVVKWEDVEIPDNLLTKAKKYLTDFQFDKMTLEVSAVDLHFMNPNGAEAFNLLDRVRIVSPAHGLDKFFPITKIIIQLDNPESTTYTFGESEERTLSGATNSMASDYIQKIEKTKSDVLDFAKNNATTMLNKSITGFVTIVKGDYGTSELIISETANWSDSVGPNKTGVRHWRWNMGGFAYSDGSKDLDGNYIYNGPAITMDGAIVADFITSGILDAGIIKAGTIKSRQGNSYWDLSSGKLLIDSTDWTIKNGESTLSITDLIQAGVFNNAETAIDRNTSKISNIAISAINSAADFIYMNQGRLYINATYINADDIKKNGLTVAGVDRTSSVTIPNSIKNYIYTEDDINNLPDGAISIANLGEVEGFILHYSVIQYPNHTQLIMNGTFKDKPTSTDKYYLVCDGLPAPKRPIGVQTIVKDKYTSYITQPKYCSVMIERFNYSGGSRAVFWGALEWFPSDDLIASPASKLAALYFPKAIFNADYNFIINVAYPS